MPRLSSILNFDADKDRKKSPCTPARSHSLGQIWWTGQNARAGREASPHKHDRRRMQPRGRFFRLGNFTISKSEPLKGRIPARILKSWGVKLS